MADDNEPIIARSIAVVAASTYASISTPTSVTTSNTASSATTLPTSKPVLTPLEKQLNKRTQADIRSDGGGGEGYTATNKDGKRPVTRKEGKRTNIEDIQPIKKLQFSWLAGSNKAFLDFLQILLMQGKETNSATFKATKYTNAIAYIKAKSGQDLSLKQLTNKYNYQKTTWRKQEAYTKACSGWGKHKVTGLPYTNKPGVIKTYFHNYIKRQPFMKKWPPYYNKLKELLARKIAYGNHTASINKALDKDSA